MTLHGFKQRLFSSTPRQLFWRVGLSFLSGLLVAAAFPPVNAWPLGVVGWIFLLKALWGGKVKCTSRAVFWLGFLHGVVSFGLSLHWLVRLFSSAAPVLIAIAALFPALFCLLEYESRGLTRNPLLKALLVAMLWTGVEFYRSELFFLRLSWITPGLALGPTSITPILGVYGGTFFVIFACALFSWQESRVWGAVSLGILLVLGALQPRPRNAPQEAFRVASVQREGCSLDALIEASKEFVGEGADLVLWPEYAVHMDLRQGYPDQVGEKLGEIMTLSEELGAPILLGTITFVQSEEFDFYNTALLVDASGPKAEYHKMRPVHFFHDGTPGRKAKPIPVGEVSVGTPICFDGDFSLILRKMAAEGAELFAIPSCDLGSWGKIQHEQHALQLPMRAAETGRWIVSSASSGPSRIIDPEGFVIQEVPSMERGALIGDVELIQRKTPYVLVGWLFPWICFVGTILLLPFSYGLRRFSVHPARDEESGPSDKFSPTGRDG